MATVGVLLLGWGAPGAASGQEARVPEDAPRATDAPREGELLVRYRAATEPVQRREVSRAEGARLERSLGSPQLQLVDLPSDRSVAAAAQSFEDHPEVAYAEPNLVLRAAAGPSDARFDEQWGLHNTGQAVFGELGVADADIDAQEAWSHFTGSRGAAVAVLDTGIAAGHPDLEPNLWRNPGELGEGREQNGRDDDGNGYVDDWRGWDFVGADNEPEDRHGHGSHVAGIIGARGGDGIGVAGVAWRARLLGLKVIDDEGVATLAALLEAIAYARRSGVRVVNASLSGTGYSQALADALSNAPDVLLVVAAGNRGQDIDADQDVTIPCEMPQPNVVCVGASDASDRLADFSNRGPRSVDLVAPGRSILSTQPRLEWLLREGFEDGGSDWAAGAMPSWLRSGEEPLSGRWSLVGEVEPNGSEAVAQSPSPLSLTGLRSCRLDFAARLTSGAELSVEAASADAAWWPVGRLVGTRAGRVRMSLAHHSGPRLALRWRLKAGGEERVRAWLDDVDVHCVDPEGQATGYDFMSGTSMATPHVAGAAALRWAQEPIAGANRVKAALISGVDRLGALDGAVAAAGRLNLRATLLAPPVPPPAPPPPPVRPPPAQPPTNGGRLTLRRLALDARKVRLEVGCPPEKRFRAGLSIRPASPRAGERLLSEASSTRSCGGRGRARVFFTVGSWTDRREVHRHGLRVGVKLATLVGRRPITQRTEWRCRSGDSGWRCVRARRR